MLSLIFIRLMCIHIHASIFHMRMAKNRKIRAKIHRKEPENFRKS
jgi:hypothetical protein